MLLLTHFQGLYSILHSDYSSVFPACAECQGNCWELYIIAAKVCRTVHVQLKTKLCDKHKSTQQSTHHKYVRMCHDNEIMIGVRTPINHTHVNCCAISVRQIIPGTIVHISFQGRAEVICEVGLATSTSWKHKKVIG